MDQAAIIPGSEKIIQKLFAGVTNAFGETLKSIIDRELTAKPGKLGYCESPDGFVSELSTPQAVIRGSLDKDFAGKTVYVALALSDAITLAGLMMMTPEEVIDQRRQSGTLDGEDLEAFAEVGNMLCAAADGVFRDRIDKPIGARLRDTGLVKPGFDEDEVLGDEPLVYYSMTIQIGDYPSTTAHVLIDAESALAWNGGVELIGGPLLNEPRPPEPPAATDPIRQRLMVGEDSFDDIPEAEIRGRLAAYLHHQEVFDVIRRSARRVGLDLERHARTEIPNPAAHRDQILVLDVPPGEDRRFEWCRRIKNYDTNVGVILVIQHPSKSRVLQGFMAKADAIVGWPLTEAVLSQKLGEVADKIERGDSVSEDDSSDDDPQDES